jgi:hypothetical protein
VVSFRISEEEDAFLNSMADYLHRAGIIEGNDKAAVLRHLVKELKRDADESTETICDCAPR